MQCPVKTCALRVCSGDPTLEVGRLTSLRVCVCAPPIQQGSDAAPVRVVSSGPAAARGSGLNDPALLTRLVCAQAGGSAARHQG